MKKLEEKYGCSYHCVEGENTTNLTLMLVGYAIYFLQSFCCSTSKYLLAKIDANDLDGYMKSMKEERMKIDFHCVCSHTERHTSGSGKNRKTTTKTVVTYREHQSFYYGSCVDKGPKRLLYPGYNVIRVDR